MKFSDAFTAAHSGHRIKRTSWTEQAPIQWIACHYTGSGTRQLKASDGQNLANWAPTNDDLFAEDWEILSV